MQSFFGISSASQKNGKFNEARTKQNEIMALFKQLAPELTNANYYRYARSFSGGLEEFVSNNVDLIRIYYLAWANSLRV